MDALNVGLTRRRLLQAWSTQAAGLACGAGLVGAVSASPVQPWRLAVVPQLTTLETAKRWSPVVQALGLAGVSCELVLHASIPQFETEFLEGKADLAYMNPYHVVMARRAQRYGVLVRDSRPLEGVLVVKNDSDIQGLPQLKGQRVSFPAPNAFAASIYPRMVMQRQYQLDYQAHFAATHRNAVRQVLAGDSAAAGLIKSTLEMEPPEVQKSLRVIYVTPPLSPHALVAHPRVPVSVQKEIIAVLLRLAQDPDQKALMHGIQLPQPLRADYQRDYATLESMDIEKFILTE